MNSQSPYQAPERTASKSKVLARKDEAMTDRVGQQFGNYKLTRFLGRGGFAEVYLAEHLFLKKKQAAIKILSTQLDDGAVETFNHEEQLIADLDHPSIV